MNAHVVMGVVGYGKEKKKREKISLDIESNIKITHVVMSVNTKSGQLHRNVNESPSCSETSYIMKSKKKILSCSKTEKQNRRVTSNDEKEREKKKEGQNENTCRTW